MSDIVERLRGYLADDHERGCQGRYYDCSCGYDAKRDPLMNEAAAEIARLREACNAPDQTLRLALGEMTAQEMRTLRAGLNWVLSRAALAAGKE